MGGIETWRTETTTTPFPPIQCIGGNGVGGSRKDSPRQRSSQKGDLGGCARESLIFGFRYDGVFGLLHRLLKLLFRLIDCL